MPEPRQPDHPLEDQYPGRCQVCRAGGLISPIWPVGLPGRYVDVCDQCRALGEEEIVRRLPEWRRDGATT